ncbi:unnamed protein product [Brassica oleracea]
MDYRLPLYLFFSLPYKEISQWEQVSSLVYSLHACPIQPGSVLKLDRLARWKRGSVVDRWKRGSVARLVIGGSDSNNLFGGDTICFILRQDLIYRVRLGCCILRQPSLQ